MKYSIIIPTYNHCDDLLKPCIESIYRFSNPDEFEIIVSANGCTDNTAQYLKELQETHSKIKVAWAAEPLGFSRPVNKGIALAAGEYIVLLNNDTLILNQPHNNWLTRLSEPLKTDPSIGISGILSQYSKITERDFLIFFCVMIRRSMIDEIGMLDEDFKTGGQEDVEFCYRAELAGYKLHNVTESKTANVGDFPIWHVGEATAHDKTLVTIDLEQDLQNNYAILYSKTRTPLKNKIILKHSYSGLGDNMCHSTLPEIFTKKGYDVYISNEQKYTNDGIKQLIDLNPYIKGYSNHPPNLNVDEHLSKKFPFQYKNNSYTARIEYSIWGEHYNEYPKIYYEPKFLPEWADKVFIDFNSVSSAWPVEGYLKVAKEHHTNCVQTKVDYTPKDIFEYLDIINSCKKFLCTYSGSNAVASAINKRNTECYVPKKWLNDVIRGGGYCYHFTNVNYIAYDEPSDSIINVPEISDVYLNDDLIYKLRTVSPSEYEKIFRNNIYDINSDDFNSSTVIDISNDATVFAASSVMMNAANVIVIEPDLNRAKLVDYFLESLKDTYNFSFSVFNNSVSDIRGQTDNNGIMSVNINDLINQTINDNKNVLKCLIDQTNRYVFDSISNDCLKKIDTLFIDTNRIENIQTIYDKLMSCGFERKKNSDIWSWINDDSGLPIQESYRLLSSSEKWVNVYKQFNPLVHIVTPTYKRFDQVKRAIESVRQQTYQHYVHHVVADGHDEDVYYYIKHLNDPRIKYSCVEHEGSLGGLPRMSVLHALKSSEQEYVCFLDDDNQMFPDYLDTLVSAVKENPKKYGMAVGMIYMDKFDVEMPNVLDITEDSVKFTCIDSLNCLIRLDLAKPNTHLWYHEPGNRITHDYDFIAACLKNTKLNYIAKVIGTHGVKKQ